MVIVTGGARGIGRAICLLFAGEGAKVAVTDIIDDEGKQVTDQIKEEGGTAEFWSPDTSDEEQVRQVVGDVHQRFGTIHVLINNAGISGSNQPTHEITEDEWNKVMNINVKGVFLCTKHIIPYMQQEGGGSIINLSSIYGIIGAPDDIAFGALYLASDESKFVTGSELFIDGGYTAQQNAQWVR